jgi:hypothetical protein
VITAVFFFKSLYQKLFSLQPLPNECFPKYKLKWSLFLPWPEKYTYTSFSPVLFIIIYVHTQTISEAENSRLEKETSG